MAPRYDVAARLAEGRDAVAHTQTYVSACRRLGYRNPDLAGYDGQLAEMYDGESGLDLQALDADCAALNALAGAADDALGLQRGQLTELAQAWRGPSAEAAVDFLRRHCDTGAELTARLRAAAAGAGVLRDELWRLVDTKVAAVQAVDDRALRPVWLAAAHAVSSGDQHAVEVIEKQVIPYVDNDVRGQWLTAVRSARDGVAAAYAAAAPATGPGPGLVFAVPGDLGPVVPYDEPARLAAVAPADVPAMRDAPLAGAPGEPAAASPVAPTPQVPLDDMPADLGVPSGLGLPGDLGLPSGGLPGGLGGLAGLGGLIPRLADAFGGTGGPFDDPAADLAREIEHPQDVQDATDAEDPEPEPGTEDADDAEDPAGEEPADESGAVAEPEPEPEVAEPVSEPSEAQEAAQTEPVPPAAESTVADPPKTPCEIAAEELPQVGR
ncbi:hypothetical protein KV112_12305 [Mycolicibacter sp. MYC123]|uniref:Alanine and proline rich protein n=1 Tax=[Mycobacterium] zoologicum TaxID=2872311 RepID=A0ABU5YKD2_9MYCO|nr:hypothetical protein [Mycolicibacter sp. MYC123]MEB3050511.1 hypothetical protein [Mycolicibacter sp. MYC123]